MQNKKIAILQSAYIPWKGYFDIIDKVDEFIFYDDVQYTQRNWRNRNQIKTNTGMRWLTIPIQSKSKTFQKICEACVNDHKWPRKHWAVISQNYGKTPYFKQFSPLFEQLYERCRTLTKLSDINELFINAICDLLNIDTKITHSSDYGFTELKKTERLVAICRQADAAVYIAGPRTKAYLDEAEFSKVNIGVEYMNYDNYPCYPQSYGKFEHKVSILDLLFNTGDHAKQYLQSIKQEVLAQNC